MLSSVISVATPADDLTLLTVAELRAAAGVTDHSQDGTLDRLGSRVADAIVQACGIATDGAVPPTLREEILIETFRLNRWWDRRDHPSAKTRLILARRPIVSVASVVEIGVTLDPASYEVRAGEGSLERLTNDSPAHWGRGKIVVTYTAGWATVPEGLKRAAEKLVKLYWDEMTRNPLLRQQNIPGVLEQTYWIGAPTDPAIPQDVMDDLGPYLNLQA